MSPLGGDRSTYSAIHSTGLRPADAAVPAPAKRSYKQIETAAYRGLVRATALCLIDGEQRKPGDVFFIQVSGLWSDDSFEPVKATGATIGWPAVAQYDVLDLPHHAAEDRANKGDGLL